MDNPFEILNNRIQRLEGKMDALIKLIEGLPQQQMSQVAYNRDTLATRQDAAKYLELSISSVDNLVKSKRLKAKKIGRAVRFKRDDLDDFINKLNK